MKEPLHTRIRDIEGQREGVVISFTANEEAIVRWQDNTVTEFVGDYDVLERPVGKEPRFTHAELLSLHNEWRTNDKGLSLTEFIRQATEQRQKVVK